jgi:hypothetical protein
MYAMLFDRSHRVLLTRAAGIFTLADLTGVNQDMAALVAQHGQMRFICDMSDVETVDIPAPQLVHHAQQIAPLAAEQKIYVASNKLVFGLCRQYASYQRHAGNREPQVVESLDEAYRSFAIADPAFEPIQPEA